LINQAIEIAGPVGAMLDSRALVYLAKKQPEAALADLEMALADEVTPVRLFHQARAYAMAGKRHEAAAALAAAKKKGLTRDSLDASEMPIFDNFRVEP